MCKIINLLAFSFLLLLAACQPPVRTIPRRIKTGLDTLTYAAVLEATEARRLDLNTARHLAGLRVSDRGWSRDCEYPEVVERARDKARRLGGNVLVILEHQLPTQSGSSCSRISADIFRVPSLEGLESHIRWDSTRPLLPGDLRGSDKGGLPPVRCELKYRLLGDFFRAITIRTQVVFLADSTWTNGDAANKKMLLRRAQLQFNLAELAARSFKNRLAALAPNLTAMTGQAKSMLAEEQANWQKRAAAFDDEWKERGRSEAVLAAWEEKIAAELRTTSALAADKTMSLKKQDYRTSE